MKAVTGRGLKSSLGPESLVLTRGEMDRVPGHEFPNRDSQMGPDCLRRNQGPVITLSDAENELIGAQHK